MRAIVIAGLLLAGCGSAAPDQGNIALDPQVLLPPTTATSLAGVDFTRPVRAIGTEPYWALDITPDQIRFEDFAQRDKAVSLWPHHAPRIAGTVAVIETKTAMGDPVTITLSGERCLEIGSEGNALPLKAVVRIGARVLTGCAGEKLPLPE